MKRTTSEDFDLFQNEFKKWQQKFGLTGYKIYFKHEPLESGFASISVDQGNMVATVRLNSSLDNDDEPFNDIKVDAKHEAIHLLLGRLDQNGRYRFTSESEIHESVEELVFKLEGLIKD